MSNAPQSSASQGIQPMAAKIKTKIKVKGKENFQYDFSKKTKNVKLKKQLLKTSIVANTVNSKKKNKNSKNYNDQMITKTKYFKDNQVNFIYFLNV